MPDSPWRSDDPFRNYQRRFDEATRKNIAERYTAGETCAEIAATLRTTGTTINRILRDAGVDIRPPGRRRGPMRRPA